MLMIILEVPRALLVFLVQGLSFSWNMLLFPFITFYSLETTTEKKTLMFLMFKVLIISVV